MLVQRLNVKNAVLNALPPVDFERLRPCLRPVLFKRNSVLEEQSRPIENICFIEAGLVSLRRKSSTSSVEIALIDSRGILGISGLLGMHMAGHQSIAVTSGMMLCMRVSDLLSIMETQPDIRKHLLCGLQALLLHTSQVALCALSHSLAQRVAGWLCHASDSVGGMEIPVSHEYIASMLGLRRASVTESLIRFEREGLIAKTRGALRVRDRDRLKQVACSCCSTIAVHAPLLTKSSLSIGLQT
ncbi:Crp/Fnr family transcriptional regulator [Bradyrhizobium sp. CCBAU 51753]|uniref:Crp/Fnr family transcriptional regulator n=1 Tax=Bradyrhizobium sp. CCBAU 51753 TaxID=1325100 RepID=UPI00188CF0C0|nr:Crp/Fnr family transcriptional regulator [Bradyrhizobium sp. CCBAU 51753]QOZ23906.1 Crp/Fnr family transcriptional regulator [Bradyrhizobium sp. CCBAU 51753]